MCLFFYVSVTRFILWLFSLNSEHRVQLVLLCRYFLHAFVYIQFYLKRLYAHFCVWGLIFLFVLLVSSSHLSLTSPHMLSIWGLPSSKEIFHSSTLLLNHFFYFWNYCCSYLIIYFSFVMSIMISFS